MKHFVTIILLTPLLGCSGNEQADQDIKTESLTIEQKNPEEVETTFEKYPTVVQMLNESYDFTEEQGSLKVLSKERKPLHIQVSRPILDGDPDDVIRDQTIRDIVYVTFQAFAKTDINEFTITSVPMQSKNNYVDKYKVTLMVSRDKATAVLKKYLNTEDFQTLFKLEGTIWVPSENFDSLKFKNLNAVYADLKV